MIEISPSGVNLYLTCPFAFRLKYIDKIEPTQENPFLLTGKLVHKGLELYFKDRIENKDNGMKPSDYLKLATTTEDFSNVNVLQLNEAIEEADHFLTIYTPIAKQLKPISSEEYFELELSDNILLKGIIDLIAQENKNRIMIDFKTTRGAVKDNYKYTLQLSFYSLTNKADAYYLHYITPYYVQIKEVIPVQKELLDDIVKNIEKSIKFGVYPPLGLGNACFSCPFRKYCKFAEIK
ncbi:MAG: PD-(D/E)XK nuclease family protein [Sulfurihydrogenibium sp.]|nr:PD-(D/E)XK nuclease family protein [Sulfurihydrogenibium sp.]